MRRELKEYIDVDGALARMCGSRKIYAKALRMFLDSKEMESFETAVLDNNLEEAGERLHTLKGLAGNLALTGLFEQSGRLMQKLRLGETLDSQSLESYRKTYVLTLGYVQETVRELSE